MVSQKDMYLTYITLMYLLNIMSLILEHMTFQYMTPTQWALFCPNLWTDIIELCHHMRFALVYQTKPGFNST